MSLYRELKRRNVLRVAAAYVVAAWLLIQVAETLFPLFGFDDTPARIVVIVLAIGFVPAMILAWAFEWTPEGLRKDRHVDHSGPADPRAGKRLDRLIMVVLALALGYFAFDKFVLSGSREASIAESARQEGRSEALVDSYGEKSIAVLPFVNMSPDPDQAYFADGISEELLNLLARIDGLRVISRTSAFQYKDSDASVTEIAETLNVAHILEGSVRRDGNSVRITAQLIDARADVHLWSETYDRNLDSIFAIQDEVARHVVEQLKVAMSLTSPAKKALDPAAYTRYLQAEQLYKTSRREEWVRVEQLLQEAIAIDPGYDDAKVRLAELYWYRSGGDLGPTDAEQQKYKDLETGLLKQVAESDPDHAELNAMLAWQDTHDFVAGAAYFERALKTDPHNSRALNSAMLLHSRLGRYEIARSLGEYFRERDPINYSAHRNLAEVYLESGELELAERAYRTTIALFPESHVAHWRLGLTLLFQGKAKAALEQFQRPEQTQDLFRLQGSGLALHDLGRFDESAAAIAALIELLDSEGDAWPYGLARTYAWLGDADQTFHFLDLVGPEEIHFLTLDLRGPFFEKIHDDPRWPAFLERIGMAPERLDAIEFNVLVPGR